MKRQRRSALAEQRQSQRDLIVSDPCDHTPLPANIAHDVQVAAQRIRRLVKRTVAHSIPMGKELLAVEAELPHGSFAPWLRAGFGWVERTERNFMTASVRLSSKKAIIADLGIELTAAYLRIAPSVRQEALAEARRRAEGGEKITVLIAKKLVSTLRQQQPARQKKPLTPVSPTKKILGV